ncbi:MAG: peptidase [Bacteroidetes bacterium]|nr:peptidase [Bacteroidota bacterium]
MKNIFLSLALIISISFSYQLIAQTNSEVDIVYNLDVTNHQDDLFHVTVSVSGLSQENNVYNFASTTPGTYSIMDFGRFVKSFNAYDKEGNELSTERLSTNRWEINYAENLSKLVYDVEDTFDAEYTENKVFPMAGTGIEEDFIVLNTFGVFGYFEGLQSNPSRVKLDYNPEWTVGTALLPDEEGYYQAETFDHLADSPFLIGELSVASTKVNDTDVEVNVYSADTTIDAAGILVAADEILQAAGEYIGYSPVTHYKFLFCLTDMETFQRNNFNAAGALEHSYSSLYVQPGRGGISQGIRNEMAHEFMHILTPLNLHSNIIQPFNFIVPTASEHIWLYEGVTEWNSDILQLRGGLISIEEYLEIISEKLTFNDRFDEKISLSQISLEAYNVSLYNEFINFYTRGAVTAAMLDIKLLDLSNGKRGLRELLLELLDKYGKDKPFPEDEFFEVVVEMTYPEIEQFINDYIKGTETLPYIEYMEKLGYKYVAEVPSEDTRPTMGFSLGHNESGELMTLIVSDKAKEYGVQEGDVLVKVLGQEITMNTFRTLRQEVMAMNVGDHCDIVVKRDDEEIELTLTLQQRMDKHIFEEMDELTEEQKFLRSVWQKNL